MRYAFLFMLLAQIGCGTKVPAPKGKPVVAAVNYPLAYFAERIGGDSVEVYFPCPSGEDPDDWTPDTGTIEKYQQADLIMLNGAGYAKWTEKAALPPSKCVDTSAAFKDNLIKVEGVTHKHGGKEHTHAEIAGHTWLDLNQAIGQAKAVRDALNKTNPDQAAPYETRYQQLMNDLQELDRDFLGVAIQLQRTPLIASHPVYQYFARAYKLKLPSVHWEPEDSLGDEQLKELAEILKGHPAKWMIWEGEPKPETVAKLKSIGIQSVVFDPCGGRAGQRDFLAEMRANLANLRTITK